MKTIKKILIILVVIMALSAGLTIIFREQLKILAVKKFAEEWTKDLLSGAALEEGERGEIGRTIGEFYGMAVKKLIPEKKFEDVWNEGIENVGLWYFYLKNFFKDDIRESGLDVLARQKALEIIDKFTGFIKDGRVRSDDVVELGDKIKFLDEETTSFNSMNDEELKMAVRKIEALNSELEKKGPGRPLDPLDKFKEVVGKIDRLVDKYNPETD